MRNLRSKSNVLFWSGLIMLVIAGVTWVTNGGIGKIKKALATGQVGTCSTAGCYSEEWTAGEVMGLYRVVGGDGGVLHDNAWQSVAGDRVCGPGVRNVDSNNWTSIGCTYRVGDGESYLDARSPMVVSQWQINGHVH
jgi:hypothetical protein